MREQRQRLVARQPEAGSIAQLCALRKNQKSLGVVTGTG